MSETYCTEAGLAHSEMFARLAAAGLHASDFSHLEDLSNRDVLQRAAAWRTSGRPVSRSRKSDAVAYLRAWAWGIEEFHDRVAVRTPAGQRAA